MFLVVGEKVVWLLRCGGWDGWGDYGGGGGAEPSRPGCDGPGGGFIGSARVGAEEEAFSIAFSSGDRKSVV